MPKFFSTKYPGVRFWESDVRNIKGQKGTKKKGWKADRCFVIRYQKNGRRISETLGWQSNGFDPLFCSLERGKILKNIACGEGHQSLKERKEIQQIKEDKKIADKEEEERDNIPFHVLGDRYIENAKTEKPLSWKSDDARYRLHLLPALGNISLQKISPLILEKLKRDLSKKKLNNKSKGKSQKTLSEKSVHHCLTLIRAMFNKAEAWELFYGKNPVKLTSKNFKKFLKISDNKRLRFLDRNEANQLLDYFKERNIQLHDITLLGIYAGLRANEIFSLLWRDIDLKTGVINIKDGKNGETRAAYITEPIREMFLKRIENETDKNALVFKSSKGEKIQEISNEFRKAIKKLGFNNGIKDGRDKVVFHSLRHTFASWAAMNGATLPTIKELMGHKSVEMSLRYVKLMPSHLKDAAESLVQDKKEKPILNVVNSK